MCYVNFQKCHNAKNEKKGVKIEQMPKKIVKSGSIKSKKS